MPKCTKGNFKQQAMQRDLDAAQKVQKSLVALAAPAVEGYQFFDFYEVANQVGGDFYDYIVLRDGRVAVVLADVSGKGVVAALVMAKISAEVRYWLASEPTAAKAVDRINESFCPPAGKIDSLHSYWRCSIREPIG